MELAEYVGISTGALFWASLVIVSLASLRLTRLITTDTLGLWLVRGPLERWGNLKEQRLRDAWGETIESVTEDQPEMDDKTLSYFLNMIELLKSDDPVSWQARLVSGLSCPFCVGFWITAGVTLVTLVLTLLPLVWVAWVAGLALLGLNYVLAHISALLD